MSEQSKWDEIRESIAKIEDVISSLKSKLSEKSKTDEHKGDDCFHGIDVETSSKIRDIIDNFNFDKVHSVMEFLGWRWAFSNNPSGIPSIKELKDFALDLLLNAAKKHTWVASGGFRVQYEDLYDSQDNFIQLEFLLEECEGFFD